MNCLNLICTQGKHKKRNIVCSPKVTWWWRQLFRRSGLLIGLDRAWSYWRQLFEYFNEIWLAANLSNIKPHFTSTGRNSMGENCWEHNKTKHKISLYTIKRVAYLGQKFLFLSQKNSCNATKKPETTIDCNHDTKKHQKNDAWLKVIKQSCQTYPDFFDLVWRRN